MSGVETGEQGSRRSFLVVEGGAEMKDGRAQCCAMPVAAWDFVVTERFRVARASARCHPIANPPLR